MRRTILILFVAAAWLIALAAPSGAITGGSPDFDHPNTGAIIVDVDWDDGLGPHQEFWCSGSLLSDTSFLTAAHCVIALDAYTPAITALYVTFDQDLDRDPDNLWWVSVPESHLVSVNASSVMPGYHGNSSTGYNDVAVLALAESVPLAPIELPAAGFLTTASAHGGLGGHSFVNVGYGSGDPGRSFFSPNAPLPWTGERETSTSTFMALTRNHLFLRMNGQDTDEGGICAGDSGSPVYFAPPGEDDENLVVAVTTSSDPVCNALSQRNRLDREEVLEFLQPYL